MSEGPLDRWLDITEWFAELSCSVTDDRDVESVIGGVVGTSHTRWQVVASGRLRGNAFFWGDEADTRGSWDEETNIDESGWGWIGYAKSTVSGSGTGKGTIFLQMGTDSEGARGFYSIRATGLTFEVATTSLIYTKDPVSGIPGLSSSAGTGEREVFFPAISEALPHSGLVLEGNKEVRLSGSDIANVSWSVRPAAAPQSCGATLRFLDFKNKVIDPNVQALAVSNHVSSDRALGGVGIGFTEKATDRSAFRLEVEDSTAGASVDVVLHVGSRAPITYRLNRKGNRYRGRFLQIGC